MSTFEKEFDIVVAGAGVAGVAAAVAAAPRGAQGGGRGPARVALVEKTVLTGGLATTGLIYEFTPLCDGRGNQVTFGLAEEMLKTSIRYGPGDVPENWETPDPADWHCRYKTRFSPAAFTLALDRMLREAGVDVWLDTLVSEPLMDGDRIVGLEVENKSGCGVLRARCVVDATGDADVAFRAGAPCEEQDNWMSLWALGTSQEAARRAVEKGTAAELIGLVAIGAWNTGQGHPEGMRKFMGISGRDVSEFVLEGRRLLLEKYERMQSEAGPGGRREVYPVTLPAMAQFRTTRRIVGRTNLEDGMAWRHFDDSVGLVANWWTRGEVWEVPYGSLLPERVKGLLAAGRCMAAAGQAWEVMRVIHGASHTGEIAGTAAALAIAGETTPDAVPVEVLRDALAPSGILHDSGLVPRPPGGEAPPAGTAERH